MTQVREVVAPTAPSLNTSACAGLTDVRTCVPAMGTCPQDCVLSDWAAWTKCSNNCTTGTSARLRRKLVDAAAGGVPCGEMSQTVACSELSCVDCQIGEWVPWNSVPCNASCGGGTMHRTKMITTAASGIAAECGTSSQYDESMMACNTQPCTTGQIFVLFSAQRSASVDVVRVAFGEMWRLNMSATLFEKTADGSAVVVTILGAPQHIDGAPRAAEIIAAAVCALILCPPAKWYTCGRVDCRAVA